MAKSEFEVKLSIFETDKIDLDNTLIQGSGLACTTGVMLLRPRDVDMGSARAINIWYHDCGPSSPDSITDGYY